MDTALPRRRAAIGAASLIVGPALMSIGDLFHPAESWNATAQVAIISQSATRWYAAHLLLFAGMLLFLPGILALTEAAASRRPAAGYATRVLMLVSAAVFSAVFVFEMLLGRFISEGADEAAAVALIDTFQSTAISGALLPGLLAFFIGAILTVVSFASSADPFRWPAIILLLGVLLIMGEIILARVLLSQIGNILCLVAGIRYSWLLRPGREGVWV